MDYEKMKELSFEARDLFMNYLNKNNPELSMYEKDMAVLSLFVHGVKAQVKIAQRLYDLEITKKDILDALEE